MAGSYKHLTDRDGRLHRPERGYAYDAIEEMYGMIWYLAHELSIETGDGSLEHRKRIVEGAQQIHKFGLEVSPGVVDG